ncbi:MAG TPA: nuclear transport factor 2 family protein [Phycisphaerae bacterium]|nr:nuclear transport factor 2 family protein [Phycisphaerales bacterium]HRX87162.1 nuclear transport factor 2 family protein [Phycisphaerae bacterium]
MSMLRYIFLENPYVLIPLLLIGTYACFVAWLRRRTPRAKRVLLVAVLLCVALPIVQQLVVTDREQIRAVCDEIGDAVEAGDVDAILAHTANDFQMYEIDREHLAERARRAIEHYRPKDIHISGFRVEVDGDRATVHYRSRCTVTGDVPVGAVVLEWKAVFVRVDGEWRLQSAEATSPLQPGFQLRDVF